MAQIERVILMGENLKIEKEGVQIEILNQLFSVNGLRLVKWPKNSLMGKTLVNEIRTV